MSTTARGRPQARLRKTLLLLGFAALLWAVSGSVFAVDVTEYGVISRFGHVLRVVDEPGLGLKAPFDRVVRLDKRLLYSLPAQAEYLTADKKNVVVQNVATWRIADPSRFLETLETRANAETRLADIILAEIGAVLGRHPFSALISPGGQDGIYRTIVSEVGVHVASFARPAYGIEIVDIGIRQLYLPEQNKQSVFERMKAERGRIAKQHRSAGELESKKIIAEAEREKTGILAKAYDEAQRIRAEGDAEAIRIYGAAFSKNPDFYKFIRTLQAYEKVLDDRTTIFLPADAEVLKVLQHERAPGGGPSASPVAGPADSPSRRDGRVP